MSVGVVILLLVPPGEAQAPLVTGIVSAASRSLGTSSRVLVDSRAATSDDDAVALSDRLHASAVVTLRWLEGGRVSLHAHWSGQAGWTDRFFAFKDTDAMDERGRTIGFTLASMVQTEVPGAPSALPLPESKREPRAPAAVPSPESKRESRPHSPVAPSPPAAVSPSSGSWPARPLALEASAQVQVAANATTVGAVFRGAFSIAPALSLTAAAGWRTGAMNDIDGQLRVLMLCAGARIPVVPARASRPYEFALLGEGIVSRETVSRTRGVAATETQTDGRWVPGAQFQILGTWFFSSRIAAVAALGAQIDFGGTDVVVNGRTATTLSSFRGLGELGIRVRF